MSNARKFPDWSPEAGIELMDANDIETAITSVPFPGFHYFPADKARELARKCNDYAADLCARWPKSLFPRFADAVALAPRLGAISKQVIKESPT
jgi:hypothetical protein